MHLCQISALTCHSRNLAGGATTRSLPESVFSSLSSLSLILFRFSMLIHRQALDLHYKVYVIFYHYLCISCIQNLFVALIVIKFIAPSLVLLFIYCIYVLIIKLILFRHYLVSIKSIIFNI